MTHPTLGRFDRMKLGKKPPRLDDRTLLLARYVDLAALPPVPDSYDLTAAVPSWPMSGNDRLGDCTCAAVGHMIQAWTYATGRDLTVPDAQIEELYWETGSPAAKTGAAGGPTDDGRDEISVLNYWRKRGVPGTHDRIGAYAAVAPTDRALVRAGTYLFGGLYIGVGLPLTAQGQAAWSVVGDGKTGDSAPYSWGGHAIPIVAYSPAGLTVVTWGGLLDMTWEFCDAYVDEVYAIISPDWFDASGATVSGFDAAALAADLAEIER